MAQFIVKAAPDHDLYIEWSTISDTPTAIGNRAEMVDHLAQSEGPSDPPEARLARADETGTSIKGEPPLRGAWDDSGFIVQKTQTNDDGPFGWLPRARLAEFANAYFADPARAEELLDEEGPIFNG